MGLEVSWCPGYTPRRFFWLPAMTTKPKNVAWVLIGVGTQLAAMVITGFALGYFTDAWLGTKPIFMFLFGCLGFIGGILKAYKLMIRLG